MSNAPAQQFKVCRHYAAGTRVFHKQHGEGIVKVDAYGRHWPYFEATNTYGTSSTRVAAIEV